MSIQSVLRSAALAVLLLTVLSAPLAAQQPERHTLTGDVVTVVNLAGVVRVEAGAGPQVEVELTRGGADAARLRVEAADDGSTLRIVPPGEDLVYPRLGAGSRTRLQVRPDGTLGGGRGSRRVTVSGSGRGTEAWADIVILLPPAQRLALHQGVGRVSISEVDGALRVEGGSASVDAASVRGSLRIDTGSGSVRVQDALGDVDLDTGSGRVEVSGIRGSRLRVDTGSGSVTGTDVQVGSLNVDVGSGRVRLARVRMEEGVIDTGSGSVALELAAPVRALRIDTGSGGVNLALPRATGARLSISTGSGGIRVDGLALEATRRSRSRLEGRVGDGEGRIVIDTGSGTVRVRGH